MYGIIREYFEMIKDLITIDGTFAKIILGFLRKFQCHSAPSKRHSDYYSGYHILFTQPFNLCCNALTSEYISIIFLLQSGITQ